MNCFEDLRQYLQLDKSQRYDFLAERLGSQVEEISIETQGRTDKHLLLNLQGEQEDNLWFSAHYDVFGEALGATDNSAAVLSLLHAVKDYRRNTKRPQSVTAVFFDAEEDGYKASGVKKDWQQGSDAFVKQLRSSQLFDGFSSLINFEVLSKGPFETYLTSTKDRIVNDEKLTKYVNSTLDQLGIVYNTVEESPRSDHVNF
ncbi:M20/M25/M40 family metallo-hydrolase, partial [Candidatus Woesearchaeota archaeon]|nr:M20/M25/M40 family metallo-hydrolase [Candidatus Woesearchaeota archaeon]